MFQSRNACIKIYGSDNIKITVINDTILPNHYKLNHQRRLSR